AVPAIVLASLRRNRVIFKASSFSIVRFFGGIFLLIFSPKLKSHLAQAGCVRSKKEKMAAEVSPPQANDDVLTVCAISLLAEIIGDVLHEGLGHAATALLTG